MIDHPGRQQEFPSLNTGAIAQGDFEAVIAVLGVCDRKFSEFDVVIRSQLLSSDLTQSHRGLTVSRKEAVDVT